MGWSFLILLLGFGVGVAVLVQVWHRDGHMVAPLLLDDVLDNDLRCLRLAVQRSVVSNEVRGRWASVILRVAAGRVAEVPDAEAEALVAQVLSELDSANTSLVLDSITLGG